MTIFGVSAGFHDASISVVRGNNILFAGHSERYSRKKNDPSLNLGIVTDAIRNSGLPSEIVYYERPWLKKTRQWFSGQKSEFDYKKHLNHFFKGIPIRTVGHHESHAAAGFYTSGYEDAAIIVCDAIGEWDTISVWTANSTKGLKKIWSTKYPNSMGLLYSAFTQKAGFKPNEEEYILMGASAFGSPIYVDEIFNQLVDMDGHEFELKQNVHIGLGKLFEHASPTDLASSIQKVLEMYLSNLFKWVKEQTKQKNLVYMGGVALNCVANSALAKLKCFDDIWIMPNPGDSGSSLGAILAHTNKHVQWKSPFLGHNIVKIKPVDIDKMVSSLMGGSIVALADGRAEFGPRALGNRSILADPRYFQAKDNVNTIKKRQKFRPFAASILEEHCYEHFVVPDILLNRSPYMQFVAEAREDTIHRYKSILHKDNTSRIQTVRQKQNPVLHEILELFYERTGCPMLLNTSMNIKGMPLVNTWDDALEFQKKYNVEVF